MILIKKEHLTIMFNDEYIVDKGWQSAKNIGKFQIPCIAD